MHLNHLPGSKCSVSWVCHKSTGLRCAVCLFWGFDLRLQPSWWMSTVQDPRKTWLATGSLLTVWWRMLVSGVEIAAAPSLLVLHATEGGRCMPPSLPLVVGRGLHNWIAVLLCYLLNPLFCEQVRLCIKVFHGKVLSLSLFFSLVIHSLDCYLTLTPSDCPQGI